MDNTVPAGGQRSTQPPSSQPTAIPSSSAAAVTPVDNKPDEVKQPPQPISNPNKEFGPMTSASPSEQSGQPEQDDEDEIKVARQEVMLGTKVSPGKEVPVSQELKEAGVEQGADTEKEIPMVVQRAGMRASSNDDLIPISAIPTVKLPINYAHAVQLDKQSKMKESIKWLARFIKRQWEKLQTAEKSKIDL